MRAQHRIWSSIWVASFLFLFAIGLAGCGQSNDGPNYADDEVIMTLRNALESRFDVADAGGDVDSERLVKLTDVELNKLSEYRSREFEDAKLQELVLTYINLLEDMKSTAENVDFDYAGSKQAWDKQYDERAQLLKDFVDNYGLTVGQRHAESLEDLVKRGNLAAQKSAEADAINALIGAMKFEKTSDGYGYYDYSCVAENTSDFDFGYVSIDLALYDADGVKAQENYATTSSWPKGEKVKFEAFSDVDASEIRATVGHYEVI